MIERPNFLPHVEGLRAVAVLAVLINHLNKEILPGGYLGVDMFFVVSGFVITRSLLASEHSSLRNSLLNFYVRRIKRLVPALSAVVLFSIVVIRLFNPNPRIAELTGLSSMVGMSNLFLFLSSTDYFGESNAMNPLMHTWSLGVEEQFYLVFPIIFLLLASNKILSKRVLPTVLSTTALISLYAFFSHYENSQLEVYYLPQYRLWELSAGCLLALSLMQLDKFLRQLILHFSVALVVIGFIYGSEYGAASTLLIVIGTAGLILTGDQPSVWNRTLLIQPMQYVGKISYSLYLWHWPFICFAIWTFGVRIWSAPIIILLTFTFAHLSFRFVESPARKSQWSESPRKSLLYGFCVISSVAVTILTIAKLDIPKFSGNSEVVVKSAGYRPDSSGVLLASGRKISDCLGRNLAANSVAAKQALELCALTELEGPWFLFLGDSHAYDMFGVSEVLAFERIGKVANFGQVGCRVPSLESEPAYCQYYLNILSTLAAQSQNERKFVVLRSNFNPRSLDGTLTDFIKRLRKVYEKSLEMQYEMIYVAPAPKYPALVQGGLCSQQWFRPIWSMREECASGSKVSRTAELRRRYDFYSALKDMESKNKTFHVFDPFDTLCGTESETCNATRNHVLFYLDESHLTQAGAEALGTAFIQFLARKGLTQNEN